MGRLEWYHSDGCERRPMACSQMRELADSDVIHSSSYDDCLGRPLWLVGRSNGHVKAKEMLDDLILKCSCVVSILRVITKI